MVGANGFSRRVLELENRLLVYLSFHGSLLGGGSWIGDGP